MKVGILGSGDVGKALARGFIDQGHEVLIGTRDPQSDKAKVLQEELETATVADFAEVTDDSELIVFSVNASGISEAIELAGVGNFAGKIVIDTVNILQPEGDLLVYGGETGTSAAEKIQSLLPDSHVVKAFNTVGAASMYKPQVGGTTPTMFIAGNDEEAKNTVSDIVAAFGWEALDAGPLFAARSLEAMSPVWVNNSIMTRSANHAFKML